MLIATRSIAHENENSNVMLTFHTVAWRRAVELHGALQYSWIYSYVFSRPESDGSGWHSVDPDAM